MDLDEARSVPISALGVPSDHRDVGAGRVIFYTASVGSRDSDRHRDAPVIQRLRDSVSLPATARGDRRLERRPVLRTGGFEVPAGAIADGHGRTKTMIKRILDEHATDL
jgi:hypothetical protein